MSKCSVCLTFSVKDALLSGDGFLVSRRKQACFSCCLLVLHAAAILACDQLVLMTKKEKQRTTERPFNKQVDCLLKSNASIEGSEGASLILRSPQLALAFTCFDILVLSRCNPDCSGLHFVLNLHDASICTMSALPLLNIIQPILQ